MKSETFRKQALSLIIFFVAVAAVFFVASRLRGDPAEKQAQTILTLLLSSSDAVEPAADDSYTASEPGLVQVDDGGFAAFYQAQFGDCMTQQCLEKLLANRLPTRIASLSGQPAGLTLQKRSGADHCYDFSADLQAADGTTTASVTGTITIVKEDGACEAHDLTLSLKEAVSASGPRMVAGMFGSFVPKPIRFSRAYV